MKIRKAIVFAVSLLCNELPVIAQDITFTNQSDLLHPVIGSAAFSDCAVDMNGDNLDDVVRVAGKGIFIDFQQADGTFNQRFFNVYISYPPSWSICAGDLDNNGLNDLLFADSKAVSFVKADEAGNQYTESIMPVFIASQRSTMADINNDGWLDAFVCNDTALSIPFRNLGDGEMIPDTNLIKTLNGAGAYAAIWTDYDNDRHIDLYISKCEAGAPPEDPDRINLLYRNNGDGTYSETGSQAGINDNAQSWSTSFEDFDNDGDFDAFVVNHDFQNRLYRNNGDGTFTDVIAASGINPLDLHAFENATGDFNNDGFIDIFSDLEQQLYLGHGDLTFTGQVLPFKPGAIADLNNDGYLDVYQNGKLWINDGGENHWLKIVPVGIISNQNGIGARVEIYGPWGRQLREVRSGQSYSPMSSLNVHFGLGTSLQVDSIKILWPSGIITLLEHPNVDTTLIIPEAACILPSRSLSVSGDTSICSGEFIEISAPGGFFYNWSNGDTTQTISIENVGNYSAIITDSAGCISMTNVVHVKRRLEPTLRITTNSSNHICEGDTIRLTAEGGVQYRWSNGLTGQSIEVTQPGVYTAMVDAICSDGIILSEPFTITVLPSPPPFVMGYEIMPGDSLLISAEGEDLYWYDGSGNIIGSGSSYQTSIIQADTVFYVEDHHYFPGTLQNGGKPDTSGTGGPPNQVGYLFFEAWEPFTLNSVDVYVPDGSPQGVRFVQLFSGDSLIAFRQFTVQTGLNILELNFNVPVGKYSLRCPQGNLFRNTEPLEYPYPIGNVGSITTSSFGDSYYYFFYDWVIGTAGYECTSARVPVHVMVSALGDQVSPEELSIYPNPTTDVLQIEFKYNAGGTLMLLGCDGRLMRKHDFVDAEKITEDLRALSPGIYILRLMIDHRTANFKIVVQ